MEGRKDPTGPDIPACPVFPRNPTNQSYMDELLQGLVDASSTSSTTGASSSQVNFPSWSPYGGGEGDPFPQSAFTGWTSFAPTLDLAGSAAAASHHHLPTSTTSFHEEYLRSLTGQSPAGHSPVTPPTDSVNSAEDLYRVYPETQDSLLRTSQSLGLDVGGGLGVDSGRDLYAKALSQLTNFTGKEYEPFGMTDVFKPPVDVDLDNLQETAVGADSTTGLSSKPSYSEVARNNPSGAYHSQQPQQASSSKSKQNPTSFPPLPDDAKFPDFPSTPHTAVSGGGGGGGGGGSSRLPSSSSSSSSKRSSKYSSWSHGGSKRTGSGSEVPSPTPVKPNSKMGLDQFEDVSVVQERNRRSEETGSNPRSRKGSVSSIGSGSSGMDDLAYFIHGRCAYSTRDGSPASLTCDTSSCDGTGSEKLDLTSDTASEVVGTGGGGGGSGGGGGGASGTGGKAKVKSNRRSSRPRSESSPASISEKLSTSSKKNTSSSSSPNPSSTDTIEDPSMKGVFFDPKRIFGETELKNSIPTSSTPSSSSSTSKTKSNSTKTQSCSEADHHHIPNNQNHGHTKDKCAANVLNNGKPKYNFMYTTNNHGKPATTHYINNDLRQPPNKKMTNTEGRNSPHRGPPAPSSKSSNTHKNSESQTETHATVDDAPNSTTTSPTTTRSPTSPSADASTTSDAQQPECRPVPPPSSSAFPTTGRRKPDGLGGKKGFDSRPHGKRSRRHRDHSSMVKGELLEHTWDWCKWACTEVTHHTVNISLLLLKVLLALLAVALSGVVSCCCRFWAWLRPKIPFLKPAPVDDDGDSFDWSNPNTQSRPKTVGLEKNIPLPTTGEEAMKRLLACKGKDPYSILGVRSDSTDEEIKKYYRKQAVLVHPDKNKIPGAEEAFKILGHSFELIGEPEKRSKYDAQRLETQETETAMHEFADLLSKLHNKMQEAANLMRCELCGGKHRRVPTERPWYNARFCDRCNVRHSAKEGDVWAESRVMGFLWHYYACMEGKIYDITEWASCQRGNFKHIQANAHHVIYRIATQAGARQRAQNNPPRGGGNNEADLEDFINHLFQRAGRTDTNAADTPQPPPGPTCPSAAANNAAKKRRKKKKH